MPTDAPVCLLLEDKPLISMDLEMTLGNAGFDVTTVMSSAEALDWLGKFRPDVVVVDIGLRDGPCHKVVEGLIEDTIPFVVYSGDHPSMHADTPFEHGIWVNKPAAPDELVAAVQLLLSH